MRKTADQYYLVLAGLFIASLVASNLIFQKFFTWNPFGLFNFEISAGILPYPVTFLITDIISEIYGRRKANRVVVAGLVSSIFITLVVYLAARTTATSWSPVDDQQFLDVFGYTPAAVGASMAAYLFAQFVDIRIFHFWKKLTKGRHLWLRNNASTIFSQLVDTATVLLILCFLDVLQWSQFGSLLLNGFLFKVLVALADTPFFYAAVWWFRRKFSLKAGEELPE